MAEVANIDVPTGRKDPIAIEVDTGGNGSPIIDICTDGVEETLPDKHINVEQKEDGKYTIVFTPPQPDVYNVSIKCGDNHVKHSPLRMNLNRVDSRAVTISKPPSGSLKAGDPITIGFDASDAGRGSLTASCKAEESGDIDVEIIREGFTAQYVVKFQPPHEDVYSLYIKWEGKNVKGSPFKLDMYPVLSSKVVASNLKEPEQPGDTIELDLCTKGAGNAELRAKCKGVATGNINVEITRSSQYNYHLTAVTPEVYDKYTLEVFFNNKHIPKSPFECTIKGEGAMGVKHLSTTISDDPDCPVLLIFDASKAGEGTLYPRVTGMSGDQIDSTSELLPDTDRHYQVSFKPPCADSYSAHVNWDDNAVPDSPFNINILYPDRLKFGELKFVELEIPVELTVDASEAGPKSSRIDATCKGDKSGPIEVLIEDDLAEPGDRKYIISFRPSCGDCYYLTVLFNDKEVSQSPFIIDIPDPPPLKPELSFSPSPKNIYNIGEKVTFGIKVTNIGEGRPDICIIRPPSSEGPPPETIIQNADSDIINVEYTPNLSGEHRIAVEWNGDSLTDSPVVFSVVDDRDIPTFPVTKPYKIHFTDSCDPTSIQAYGIHEESGDTNDIPILKRRNGKVKLTYKARTLGVHSLHVIVDGKEVSGSPFRVKFVPSDPKAVRLTNVPDMAYVGEETRFKLDAREAGDGDKHVTVGVPSGAGDTVFSYENHGDGLYSIIFKPIEPGVHEFHITWSDVPILESPVKIDVKKRHEDTKKDTGKKIFIHREDYSVFDTPLTIKSPPNIHINTTKVADNGILSLRATGPGKARIFVYSHQYGVYNAIVKPVVTGKYTLDISWDGLPIKDSPFQLNFTKEKSYLINGLDLENVHFEIGVPHKFHIHCPEKDLKECNLILKSTPTTAADISCLPLEGCPNSFVCEIIPREIGNHEVTIEYNSQEVHGSPHTVLFDENPNVNVDANDEEPLTPMDMSIDMGPSISPQPIKDLPTAVESSPSEAVRAFGAGLKGGLAGQEGNFTIAGIREEGKLEVEVYGPKGAFHVNVRRHPEIPHTLLARYDPKVEGEYKISVLWNGKNVVDSPYTVNISKQVAYTKPEAPESNTKELELEQTKEDLELEPRDENMECEVIEVEVIKEDLAEKKIDM